MGSRLTAALLATFLLVVAGCVMGRRKMSGATARRRASSALPGWSLSQLGQPMECKDNGAVNVELHPEYPVGYSCYNEAGEFTNAMISPDGRLLSVSRPIRLKPAEDS